MHVATATDVQGWLQEDKLGLRWRTEAEVLSGKGQFSCGARGCSETRGLATFEVPFGYEEAGERKEALVKVRMPQLDWPNYTFRLDLYLIQGLTDSASTLATYCI